MTPLLIGRARRLAALLAAGTLALSTQLQAQTPPRLLSYQGVLADAQRVAVSDGSYTMTFRIYSAPTGGTALWEETGPVTTVGGIFETVLGTTAPLALPFDRPYWLATQLQGEPEMTPRVQLVAAPYAVRAHEAENALRLDAAAPGVVHTLNTLDGNLVLIGEGAARVRVNGDTLAVVVPSTLPNGVRDGQVVRWNGALGAWEAVDPSFTVSPRLNGNGTAASPLDIAQQGASDGQPLVWNAGAGAWTPGTSQVLTTAPLRGTGVAGSPIGLESGTADRQVLTWNGTAWTPAEQRVRAADAIEGDGTLATPLRLAQQGAAAGQVLRWDSVAGGWRPGPPINLISPPLAGSGTVGNPLRFMNGGATGQMLYWDGTVWKVTTARAPQEGEVLRWNSVAGIWEPMGVTVTGSVPLSTGALWYGNGSGRAAELPVGTPGQVLVVRPDAGGPAWASSLALDSLTATAIRTAGDVIVGGGLRVFGSQVDLPAGTIDNSELADSAFAVSYGAGISGDPSVALGGTLQLRNTGVLTVNGTPNRVSVDTVRGDVTLTLPQDIHPGAQPTFAGVRLTNLAGASASDTLLVSNGGLVESRTVASMASALSTNVVYGNGINGDAVIAPGGTLNIRNTGVLTVNGTPNRISVDTVRGNVTLTLPQDIHTNARPTFDGVTLDNLTNGSTSDTLLVSLGGAVQSRTVASLASSFNGVFWSVTGNAGTTPGTNFVGTSDNQPLELRVDNANATATNGRGRVMRYEPTATSPNIIGGFNGNSVGVGIVGATISGGGSSGATNSISGNNGTISGGSANTINASAQHSTISGGSINTVGTTSPWGTISGGARHYIRDNTTHSTISGGYQDTVYDGANYSVISGGQSNSIGASSTNSTISGGNANKIGGSSTASTIAGGSSNQIAGSSTTSVISGGSSNVINGSSGTSTIAGGSGNQIATGANTSVISGGSGNRVNASASTSTVAGGSNNVINSTTSVIGGGDNATIGTNSRWSAISGGHNNTIADNAFESIIGAGEGNDIGANASNSTISGGYGNAIRANADRSTIGGGMSNVVNQGTSISTIAGGFQNTIDTNANTSAIGGGTNNKIGTSSTISVISGGSDNNIAVSSSRSTIGGGNRNYIAASGSVIAGGENDSISASATQGAIGGGTLNKIGASSTQATISGGTTNTIGTSAFGATIAGGSTNSVGNSARLSTIAGGRGLTLDGRGSFGYLGGNDAGTRNMSVSATDVAVFGNTDLWLANNDNAPSQMRFYEANNTTGAFPGTANYSSFQAQAQAADISYVLPDTAGIAGDVLAVKTVSGSTVTLDWAASGGGSTDWSITGNSGTTPGTNFLGTVTDVAFQIHVGNGVTTGTDGRGRVMRFEPNATSANIIGGFASNSVTAGIVGATISGGGANGGASSIASNYGTIGGGRGNSIGASSINATIAGGVSNQVGGSAGNGTVGGGLGNVIVSGDHTTIDGGFNNRINTGAFGSKIGGGTNNALSSHTSVIGGGNGNTIGTSSQFSTIAGGHQNSIGNSAFESLIAGGTIDTIEASATYSTIGGGTSHAIRASATRSTIAGGYDNEIGSSADRSTISGGDGNRVGSGAYRTVIAGGYQNNVAANARWGTIGGGEQNSIFAVSGTISGGTHDTVEAQNGFIGGGDNNRIRNAATFATIAGGRDNEIDTNSTYGVIAGGQANVVNGTYATVSGGYGNTANASYTAVAGGRGMTLSGAGSFGFLGANTGANNMTVSATDVAVFGNTDLWLANNNNTASQMRLYEPNATTGAFPGTTNYSSFQSAAQTADIEYVLPATAGVAGDQLTISAVAGTQVTLGWAAPSDRRIKSEIITLNGEDILTRFRGLPLGSWRYTSDLSGRRHYGIMAQDFKALFGNDGVGPIGTDTTVNDLDLIGVSYLAIQGLESRTSEQRSEIDELKEAVRELQRQMNALREENQRLREGVR